jgi:hypothetical protein
MSLIVLDPPADSIEALRPTLRALTDRGRFADRRVERARPEQVTVTVPHQVYTLGAQDLVEKPGLATARPIGWRYLVEANQQVVGLAETTGMRGAQVFSQLSYGPFVTGTTEAIGAAERYAADNDFELRAMHIPALYFLALWLQPAGKDDSEAATLIPVSPAPAGIEANRPYAVLELFEILSQRARDLPILAADDRSGA